MDQAIACCGKILRVEDVRGLLGMFGTEVLLAVANAIQQRIALACFRSWKNL